MERERKIVLSPNRDTLASEENETRIIKAAAKAFLNSAFLDWVTLRRYPHSRAADHPTPQCNKELVRLYFLVLDRMGHFQHFTNARVYQSKSSQSQTTLFIFLAHKRIDSGLFWVRREQAAMRMMI